MQEQYEFLFKFLIIGNAGVGKSCLLHQFIENKMKVNSVHTIGVEFASKIIQVNNRTVKLQIWDTAGQERFRSVARSYYRGASGALVVYDVTNRDSYSAATSWLEDARNLAGGELCTVLVGNKRDLAEERGGVAREVSVTESEALAKELSMLRFVETSAVTGERVVEAFEECARAVVGRLESEAGGDVNEMTRGGGGGYSRVGGGVSGGGSGDVRQKWNRRSDSPAGGIRLSRPRDGTRSCSC